MAWYAVRYYSPGHAGVVEDRLEADSEPALRAGMSARGAVLLQCEVTADGAGKGGSRPVSRPTRRRAPFEVTWWCRELRTLLKAGMTAVEAVDTLHAQSQGTEREAVHVDLLKALGQGQSLSRAMQGTGVFPDVLVASVAASERTSTLVSALDDYLRYDEMLRRLRSQATSAAIYPLVVVGLGSLIAVFLLLYVVPRFSRMYGSGTTGLSGVTEAVLWFSAFARQWMPALLGGLALLLVAAVAAWRSGSLGAASARMADAIAPLRHQIDHYRLAKLYQSLALMFRGGYTLDEAMVVCEGLQLGERVGAGLASARRDIARGRNVSSSFATASLADTVGRRLLAVGERTGSFDTVLQTMADRHAEAFAKFVERATRLVEPVLLLGVALMVGGIVVMMYMPIFDIANTIR
jgi:general secretion pathway protein F